MGIKHKFRSAIDDEGMPAGAVKPSNWNDDHEVEGLLGGLLALGLQPNVIPYLDAAQNGGVIPVSDFVRTLVMNVASAPAFRALVNAASLDSPSFTGSPTAITQAPGDNSTRLATTAYTDAAITALIGGAPVALNTLNELAAALADDENFASTVTNALALKAPLNSPALTGTPLAPTQAPSDNSSKIATTAYADAAVAVLSAAITAALAQKAPLNAPAFTGNPTAVTPPVGNATTRLATTAFVMTALNQAQAIANGTDFNTITAEGTYYNTGACANTPVTSGAFFLHVQAGQAGGNVSQRAVEQSTGNAYQRVQAAGVWQPWISTGFTAGQIPAGATATQPGAGKVGELVSASFGGNFAGSTTPQNYTSFVLQPGVWDVEAYGVFGGQGATTSNDWILAISTVSGSVGSNLVGAVHERRPGALDYSVSLVITRRRVAISVPTTYYLNAQATFSGGTYGVQGDVQARRA